MSINKYSIKKGLIKAFLSVVLVGIPVALQALPQDWQNLTLGGALILLYNYLKVVYIK